MSCYRLLLILTLSGSLSAAFAGDQYVDETGFAVSGYDVVAYFGLTQSPIGQAQPSAVPGSAEFTAEYNGASWAFSSAANRDEFLANPTKYAPAYDGHCAYGISQGGKVPANPHLWRIVDDRLLLNINDRVVGFFEEDIPGTVATAESKWPEIEPKPASAKPVPGFDAGAAPAK